MLKIYDSIEDLENVKVIHSNDIFFNAKTELSDSYFTRRVLSVIDKAGYGNSKGFYGRIDSHSLLDKTYLSTGAKTLLNIYYNPDICFNVCECGRNALCLLPLIENGIVYWETPVVLLDNSINDNYNCNIFFANRSFNDFRDFLNFVSYEY